MRKLKQLIRRIKRHNRNKKLSKFADNIFYATTHCPYVTVLVHPLVFEIIRFRYFGKMFSTLSVDYFAKDCFDILTIQH